MAFDEMDDDDEIAKAEGEMLAELVKEIVEAMVEAKAEEITAAVAAKIAALPKPNALDEANLQGQIRGFLRSAMSEELGAALTTVEQRVADIAEKLQSDIDQTDQTAAALGQTAVAVMEQTKAEIVDLRGVVAAGSNLARTAGEAAQGAVAKVEAVKDTVDGFLADQKPLPGMIPMRFFDPRGYKPRQAYKAGTALMHAGYTWITTRDVKAGETDTPSAGSKAWAQLSAVSGYLQNTPAKIKRLEQAAGIIYADVTPPAGPNNTPYGGHARFWVRTTDNSHFVSTLDDGGVWIWSQGR